MQNTPEAKYFLVLMKMLPLAARQSKSTEIITLCDHFKLDYSVLQDQRKCVATSLGKSLWKVKHEELPKYKINVRGLEWDFVATLPEAARFVQVTETSLRNRVARGKIFSKAMNIFELDASEAEKKALAPGKFLTYDIVTVEKLTPEEQALALESFHQISQTVAKPSIQSVSPTRP